MLGGWGPRTWRVVAVATTTAVVVGSFLPPTDVPAPPVLGFDKVLHFLAYAAVAFLWRRAGLGVGRVVVLGVVLAVVTEVGQGLLVPGRVGDVLDGVANVLGLLVGLALGRPSTPETGGTPETDGVRGTPTDPSRPS